MPVGSIAVVGCGIGGMAAALALHRAGVSVRVFERFEEPHPLGAGLLLQPTGQSALARLGLLADAVKVGARINGIVGRRPNGRTVLDQRYADRDPEFFGLGIQRGAVFQLLYHRLLAEGISVRAATRITEIDSAGTSAAVVDAAGARHGPFDLVIVADGAFSELRYAGGRPSPDRDYTWGAVWGLCNLTPDWSSDQLSQVYDSPRIMIGALPVGTLPGPDPGPPQVSFFWSLKAADLAAWRAGGLEAWRARVLSYWPQAESLLQGFTAIDQLLPATYRDCYFRRPWQGRVVLIGDAAHAMSPQFGQGANMALVDAVLLAEALGGAEDTAMALERWWRWRAPHVALYQRVSRWFTPLFQGDSRFLGWMRDRFLPIGCAAPGTKQLGLALMTGVKYGWFRTLDPLTLRPRGAGGTIGNTRSEGV